MAGPLNYSTVVPTSRTIAEVHDLLREYGADAVATTYTDRAVSGVRFQFHGSTYDLPADVDAMLAVLKATDPARLRASKVKADRPQAERVVWRVVKDWLEAQLALVAARQAGLDEVMLPYLITNTGRALREDWRGHLALPAGS